MQLNAIVDYSSVSRLELDDTFGKQIKIGANVSRLGFVCPVESEGSEEEDSSHCSQRLLKLPEDNQLSLKSRSIYLPSQNGDKMNLPQ